MKKTVVIAVALIGLGLALIVGSLASQRFDLSNFRTEQFEVKTYDVDGDFKSITIRGTECDVRLVPAKDGRCRVEATDSDDIITDVAAAGGTLTITRNDRRAWYERGFWFGALEPSRITVYLPEVYYKGELNVLTVSGDIEIPGFAFERAKVQSTSGDVTFLGAGLEGASIKTVSGDVSGTLLSPKVFETHTTSGNMDVPRSDSSGGTCTVRTTSGNVRLDIAQ